MNKNKEKKKRKHTRDLFPFFPPSLSLPQQVHTRKRPFWDIVRRSPSVKQETKLARTLILLFWPPKLQENMFLLFNPYCLCYFVMAARAD